MKHLEKIDIFNSKDLDRSRDVFFQLIQKNAKNSRLEFILLFIKYIKYYNIWRSVFLIKKILLK
jgi:hypothetical protein